MTEAPLEALLLKLQGPDAGPITEAIAEIRERFPALAEADRRRAVEALGSLFYIDLYERGDLERPVRLAEETLVEAGEAIVPMLIRMMEGSDFKSHFHLARVLGRIGPPALSPLRRLVATAEEPYSRSFALYAIGKMKSPQVHEALPEVTGSLMHPDKEVRDSAARTLGKIVEVVPPSDLTERRRKEIYQALRRATGDQEAAVRAKAVRSAGKMAARGYLAESDRDDLCRRLKALLGRGPEEDWDRAYVVRREAQEALGHLA